MKIQMKIQICNLCMMFTFFACCRNCLTVNKKPYVLIDEYQVFRLVPQFLESNHSYQMKSTCTNKNMKY